MGKYLPQSFPCTLLGRWKDNSSTALKHIKPKYIIQNLISLTPKQNSDTLSKHVDPNKSITWDGNRNAKCYGHVSQDQKLLDVRKIPSTTRKTFLHLLWLLHSIHPSAFLMLLNHVFVATFKFSCLQQKSSNIAEVWAQSWKERTWKIILHTLKSIKPSLLPSSHNLHARFGTLDFIRSVILSLNLGVRPLQDCWYFAQL